VSPVQTCPAARPVTCSDGSCCPSTAAECCPRLLGFPGEPQCAAADEQCCTPRQGGGFCHVADTCCPPGPLAPDGSCAPPDGACCSNGNGGFSDPAYPICCPLGSDDFSCSVDYPVCCPAGFPYSCCPAGTTCDAAGGCVGGDEASADGAVLAVGAARTHGASRRQRSATGGRVQARR
jgi:hypothetical protein